jgi:hypothetical protein
MASFYLPFRMGNKKGWIQGYNPDPACFSALFVRLWAQDINLL